jgi:basic membrane protein A
MLLSVLLAFSLVAAACGDDDDAETDTSTESGEDEAGADDSAPAAPSGDAVKACVATGQAGVDDQSFNASAWEGVQAAVADGVATEDSFFLEPGETSQYQAVVTQLIEQGCEHIVTIGFDLGEVTATNAADNPDITWTMVDNILSDPETFAPLELPNVRELVYQTDEAAFAAGYLAAGMSQTGVLCTYGGGNFPTVSIFMDGFTRGAQHYNEVKGADVSVLGWDPEAGDGIFTGSFTDMGLARSTADGLFQEDCDMILPVGGAINLPAGDAINDLGIEAALIGVDSDAYFAMDSQYQSLWLTTIEKKIAEFVTESVAEHAGGTWEAGSFVGTLANGGIGLSPFHDWDDRVPDELRAEVDQLLADIADGTLVAAVTPVGY